MKRLLPVSAAFLLLIAVFTQRIYSYSYDAFNGMTGKGVVSFDPTLSFPISQKFGTAADIIGSYGFTPNFDLFADAADFALAPEAGYAYS